MRNIHCPKDIGFENTFSGEDCKKEEYYNNCYHCWTTALAPHRTVTEFADRCKECGAKCGKLLKQKSDKWIPVSERLPEENKTVIASTKYGVYPETKYTKEYGWEWAYESGADYWRELDEVEAWMPLPKRYEPESEE